MFIIITRHGSFLLLPGTAVSYYCQARQLLIARHGSFLILLEFFLMPLLKTQQFLIGLYIAGFGVEVLRSS